METVMALARLTLSEYSGESAAKSSLECDWQLPFHLERRGAYSIGFAFHKRDISARLGCIWDKITSFGMLWSKGGGLLYLCTKIPPPPTKEWATWTSLSKRLHFTVAFGFTRDAQPRYGLNLSWR